MTEYLSLPRAPQSWILEDILPTSGLLNIYGQPKCRKSFFALQIAEAISNPDIPEVLGFPVHQHGRVAYLQVDTPRGLWADRIVKWFPSISDTWFADSLIAPYPFDILSNGMRWLREEVDRLQPLVVIIDTLREIHIGDENVSDHMQLVVNTLQAAVRPAACIMISHARKNRGEGSFALMGENRGSGYVAGRCDCVLHLGNDDVAYQGRAIGELHHKIHWQVPYLKLSEPHKVVAERMTRNHPEWTEAQRTAEVTRLLAVSKDAARGYVRRADAKRTES